MGANPLLSHKTIGGRSPLPNNFTQQSIMNISMFSNFTHLVATLSVCSSHPFTFCPAIVMLSAYHRKRPREIYKKEQAGLSLVLRIFYSLFQQTHHLINQTLFRFGFLLQHPKRFIAWPKGQKLHCIFSRCDDWVRISKHH